MAPTRSSLRAGRNRAPLSAEQVKRATNTFLGFDSQVNARYDAHERTGFRVTHDGEHQFGEIVFGPDIYPGTGIVDPNSALSLEAAVAHELTHYSRWKNLQALPETDFEHLDEAFTSLQAISYFSNNLSPIDIRQLAADAMQRLQLFMDESLPLLRNREPTDAQPRPALPAPRTEPLG